MKTKKILSLLLALALVLSVLGVAWPQLSAFELDDVEDIEDTQAPEETAESSSQDITYGPAVYDEDGNLLYYEYYIMPAANTFDYTPYQLTDEQLALPTEELLELVLNSWLVELHMNLRSAHWQYMAVSTYRCIRDTFNGARELEARADVVEVMLAKLAYYVENPDADGRSALCFLLRQSEFLDQMTPEQLDYVAEAKSAIYGLPAADTWECD